MVYLELDHVLALHALVIVQSGGAAGIRNRGGLESAGATPKTTFDGEDLYPDLVAKAAAPGYSLVMNHPFVDGNKRVGHAAMEVTLVLLDVSSQGVRRRRVGNYFLRPLRGRRAPYLLIAIPPSGLWSTVAPVEGDAAGSSSNQNVTLCTKSCGSAMVP